ncbi:MAG TPA: DUF6526 family protein [Thermoanaerobaculia bacterium]|jgi:hypothetical protein|nr:DUF6526 family protein [Thermoanaerobaculia bacterium]
MPEPLSYKTHRAYDPLYHFFVIPVLGINVLLDAYMLFRRPVWLNVWALVFGLALVALTWRVRYFPLRIQDRLIRLEETLRLQSVLPEDLRARIGEISTRELIALRFCTDDELPEHVRAIYAGDYRGGENVKSHIKSWRPDPHRI